MFQQCLGTKRICSACQRLNRQVSANFAIAGVRLCVRQLALLVKDLYAQDLQLTITLCRCLLGDDQRSQKSCGSNEAMGIARVARR